MAVSSYASTLNVSSDTHIRYSSSSLNLGKHAPPSSPSESLAIEYLDTKREASKSGVRTLQDGFGYIESRLRTALTQWSPLVEAMDVDEEDVVPGSPASGWTAAGRLDVGITTGEPPREGWETLVNWDG